MGRIEKRLAELGLALPKPFAAPAGVEFKFDLVTVSGGLGYVSGHLPTDGADVLCTGKVGADVTVEEGYEAARLTGGSGEFAIITGALSAANQNEWMVHIRKRLADKYPALKVAAVRPSDDDRDKAFAEAQTILRVHPDVKLLMAISAPAVPGAAEAIRQAGRRDVNVIGLSLPNINKPYVHDGIVQTVVLWNTRDLGYATVYAGVELLQNKLSGGARLLQAGRLGSLEIRGSEIILGPPLKFTKANIDQFDF